MKCSWCQQREVEFELAIYYLKKEQETVANCFPKQIQYIRDGLYVKVQICEKCLPCTATKNPLRTRLRGSEVK